MPEQKPRFAMVRKTECSRGDAEGGAGDEGIGMDGPVKPCHDGCMGGVSARQTTVRLAANAG